MARIDVGLRKSIAEIEPRLLELGYQVTARSFSEEMDRQFTYFSYYDQHRREIITFIWDGPPVPEHHYLLSLEPGIKATATVLAQPEDCEELVMAGITLARESNGICISELPGIEGILFNS